MNSYFLYVNNKNSKKIFIYWLLSIFAILLITTIGNEYLDSYLFNLENLFDIKHYLEISKHGYTNEYQFAFFPLVPLIMSFFNLLNMPLLGMVVLNNILCLISAYIIYAILEDIYNISDNTTMIIIMMWLFSPIRVFNFVPYTESLFTFLSFFSFYLYKKGRNPIVLGIMIGLSVTTRSLGSIMFFVIFGFLFIEMIRDKNEKSKVCKFKYIVKTYIPATIISCLYPLYLYINTGNWRYFIDVQYEHWHRDKGNLINILIYDIKRLFKTTHFEVYSMIILTFISLLVVLVLILYFVMKRKFIKFDLALMLIISLLTIFSTFRKTEIHAGTSSFFRYIYALIPMYLLVDDEMNVFTQILLLSLNIIMFIFVTFMFLGDNFIA